MDCILTRDSCRGNYLSISSLLDRYSKVESNRHYNFLCCHLVWSLARKSTCLVGDRQKQSKYIIQVINGESIFHLDGWGLGVGLGVKILLVHLGFFRWGWLGLVLSGWKFVLFYVSAKRARSRIGGIFRILFANHGMDATFGLHIVDRKQRAAKIWSHCRCVLLFGGDRLVNVHVFVGRNCRRSKIGIRGSCCNHKWYSKAPSRRDRWCERHQMMKTWIRKHEYEYIGLWRSSFSVYFFACTQLIGVSLKTSIGPMLE